MPARLLVVAEPKMLPALANGLREGGRFEVVTGSIGDLPGAQAASDKVDALALFYGAADKPLAAALQHLAPGLRERGARVVAVLQKDQAAQRDDCFRAGASDVLFMPLPKEQFVSRLAESVALAFAGEGGLGAEVSVSTRGAAHKLEALVVAGGLLASAGPEIKQGETVRLAWTAAGLAFQAWGLVVRSDAAGVRIRFAGSTPEEEIRLREWLRSAPGVSNAASAAPAVAPTGFYPPTVADVQAMPGAGVRPAPAPTVVEVPAAPQLEALLVAPSPAADPTDASAAEAEAAAASPAPAPPTMAPTLPMVPPFTTPAGGTPVFGVSSPGTTRSGPTAGPPPGFAQRPLVRPQGARMAPSLPGAPTGLAPVGSAARTTAAIGPMTPSFGTPATPARPATPPGGTAIPAVAKGTPPFGAPAAAAPAPIADAAVAPAPAANGVAAEPAGAAGGPQTTAAGATVEAGLSGLFDDVGGGSGRGAGASGPEAAAAAAPIGHRWPVPLDPGVAKNWLQVMLRERNLPSGAGPDVNAAFIKVAGGLSSGEREALEKAGPESHLHEALLARVALAHAGASGVKLYGVQPPAVIDAAQVAALAQQGDAAGKRLQGEADKAITKGEVESLQMVTAASAALSREQLSFKETVDRLKGLAAAPRMGAGALDPDVAVPGQAARVARAGTQEKEKEKERRTELKDFAGLGDKSSTQSRKRMLVIGSCLLAVSLANVLWWSHPGAKPAAAQLIEKAGVGVINILISDQVAMVRVTKIWANSEARKENVRKLCTALESRGVKKAIIEAEGTGVIGQLDVAGCKAAGLPPVKPPVDPNAPPAPPK